MYFLRIADDLHLRDIDTGLLIGRRDSHDFRGARRQILHHGAARTAQQHGLEFLAQLVKIFVAEYFTVFIGNAVTVEEAKCRS